MTVLPRVIVVMGVSGAGKTTIGSALAKRLGRTFIDADDLHPAANKAKMAQGHPLDDTDRMPWLDAVAAAAATGDAVVACSALRRRYRERLQTGLPDVFFVELYVAHTELERRVRQRSHEYMPPTLLTSQLATLEPLTADETGLRITVNKPITNIVPDIVDRLPAASQSVAILCDNDETSAT